MRRVALLGTVLLFPAVAQVQWAAPPATKAPAPAALLAEIESLKRGQVAWREIPWKSCLLEDLAESKVSQARKEHERKIEAILSAAQKKRRRVMLGKQFDLGEGL